MLFTFPSRYLCTIGHQRVFSLTRWFWQIHTGPHVPRATQELPHAVLDFAYRTITFYGQAFQNVQLSSTVATRVLQPQRRRNDNWFGLLPFRSPLLRESLWFSFPPGTEMFHFPGFAAYAQRGYPIRRSADISLLTAPRSLSQLSHVLHRLLMPRHPPNALSNLNRKSFH